MDPVILAFGRATHYVGAQYNTTAQIEAIMDSLAEKIKMCDFCFERGGREEIASQLQLLFEEQWPIEEPEQNHFVCQLCEQIGSKSLKDLLGRGTNIEQYYETLTKLAAVNLLFSTGENLYPQDYHRFDEYFRDFYPTPTHMQRAKLKIFISCQAVLKNRVEEKLMPIVDIKYKNQTFKAHLFDGLAWTFIYDSFGRVEDRRTRGVEAYRFSDENIASDPFNNDLPWNENFYEKVDFPTSDMDYWKKQINQYLTRVSLLMKHPAPAAGLAEKLIGKITYATARFHLWGFRTEQMLSFQAKILSSVLGAKPPQSTSCLYQQILVRGEKSFCDDIYLPSIAGQTIPELPEHMADHPLREIKVSDFRSNPHKELLNAFWTLPLWVKKDYEEASEVYQQFSKEKDTQKALMDVQNWVSKLTEERKKAEYSSALVLHFVVAPLYNSITPHL